MATADTIEIEVKLQGMKKFRKECDRAAASFDRFQAAQERATWECNYCGVEDNLLRCCKGCGAARGGE